MFDFDSKTICDIFERGKGYSHWNLKNGVSVIKMHKKPRGGSSWHSTPCSGWRHGLVRPCHVLLLFKINRVLAQSPSRRRTLFGVLFVMRGGMISSRLRSSIIKGWCNRFRVASVDKFEEAMNLRAPAAKRDIRTALRRRWWQGDKCINCWGATFFVHPSLRRIRCFCSRRFDQQPSTSG